ncbi:MAG: CinA family protein, partial [Alistipes sp.]|nr:CinA family protein [Alistipes sp.]
MKATVVTIGDEILIGQIVDTNTVSIARHLNSAGITVAEKISVADDADAICDTVRRALSASDLVIITGGLGPTKDDITKYTLAEMFGLRLIYNEPEAEHIRTLLARRGIEFGQLNRSQAMVPECCTVLHNAHGTAPGMWFDCGDDRSKVVVSLPGVPFEMEHLMQDEVMPRIKSRFELHSIVHRTMITRGIAESVLAATIASWEDALPAGVKLAYLPSPNIVRLRLSAYDVDGRQMSAVIDNEFSKLYNIIPDNIVGFEDATVERLVHELLTQRGATLAVAESCTGGAIASKFT